MTGPRSLGEAARNNAMAYIAPSSSGLARRNREFFRHCVESCNMKNGPNRGKTERGGEQPLNQGLQVGGLDLLNLVEQLLRRQRPSMDEDLPGELLGPRARAFEAREQAHFELGLYARDLVLAEALLGSLDQLVADHGEQLVRAIGAAPVMDGEHTAVGQR